jgi:hypothetical protein
MNTKADRFRQKARECESLADEARDPAVKQNFADLAADWRSLAAQIERQGLDQKRD